MGVSVLVKLHQAVNVLLNSVELVCQARTSIGDQVVFDLVFHPVLHSSQHHPSTESQHGYDNHRNDTCSNS